MTTTLAASNAPLSRTSTRAEAWERHGEAITTALCALFVTAGWMASRAGLGAFETNALYLAGYVLGGYRQAIEGVTTLIKDRELDVDLLMVVAAMGAACIGYWFDGALLIFIFASSGTLEGYASARTKRDIEALMALHPEDAVVLRDGVEHRVLAASVAVGETLVVKPGERIAADGIVIDGSSAVNQASITGECVFTQDWRTRVLRDRPSINGRAAVFMEAGLAHASATSSPTDESR